MSFATTAARRGLQRLGVLALGVTLIAGGATTTTTTAAAAPAAGGDTRPWMQQSLSSDERANVLLGQMTLDEKIELMTGNQGEAPTAYYNAPITRLGIPALRMADAGGGIGARGWQLPQTAGKATAMPSGESLAATFDPDLTRRYAGVVADEAKQTGHNMLLGPNADIVRSPWWGRTSETGSEDTFLTSAISTPFIDEVQSRNVIANLKHFVAYNQEINRGNSQNSIVGERALREVYVPPYADAITKAGLGSIMCSFNRINGTFSCENEETLGKVLRDDLGFAGFVITDFGAIHSTDASVKAGSDMETGTNSFYGGALRAAVDQGRVPVSLIDRSVVRILRTMFKVGLFENDYTPTAIPVREHGRVARDVQEQAITLLKNDAATLPLADDPQSLAVIGADATITSSPAGAPHVLPTYEVPVLDGITTRAEQAGADVTYVKGNDPVNGASMLETPDMTAVPSSVLRPASGQGSGLTAQYFDNTSLSGNPFATRTEAQVNYDTGFIGGQPAFANLYASQVPPTPAADGSFGGNQSVRYTGTITAPATGTYRLSLTGWGDARLFLDGRVVADMTGRDGRQVATSADLSLVAGQTASIRVDYRANRALNSLEPGTLLMQWSTPDGALSPDIQAAVAAARAADTAVVYVKTYESEQRDRVSLKLPQSADALISAVAAANPDTVVVLATGGSTTMPWLDEVPAVLQGYFGGQEEGGATARVLFGDVNPSGRLPITYPRGEKAVPAGLSSPWTTELTQDVTYDEGIFVGYKGYDRAGITPLFPFGYGLSYTSFGYSGLTVRPTETGLQASFTVRNTGDVTGTEVPQVYIGAPTGSPVPMPVRSLVGFDKVTLTPGASTVVTVPVDVRDLSYWSVADQDWRMATGARTLQVGPSSTDARLTAANATAGVFSPVTARPADRNGFFTSPVVVSGQLAGVGGQATCTPVTYSGPDGVDIPVTVTCTTPGGATSTHTVTISYDATAAGLAITKPTKAKKVTTWRSARGTVAIGAGSPLDVVQVSAVQKRGNRWVALRNGRWVKAPSRKAAFARATATTATVTGERWQQPLSGLRRGRLVLKATVTDVAGNAATVTRAQRLKR